MDPAGIREILLLRPYAYNPYQLEPIAGALPYKVRTYPYYSSIPWLPVFPPLTQRVGVVSEGYTGLLAHDCLVMAGTDPESLTERDIQHLRSAMERGLPVMACGGLNALGNSYRRWHDLEAALPARVPPAGPVQAAGEVTAVAEHPILRGLPPSFGKIDALHPLEVAADARVLLAVDGKPVLVAGERCGGRQLILAVAEAGGLCTDPFSTEQFYGHPFYPDLLRQALTWLMGVPAPLRFTALDLPTGTQLTEPGEHELRATVQREGELAGARLRCSLFSLDEGRLASGGDAARDALLFADVRPIDRGEQAEGFTLADPLPGKTSGIYEVELALEMDEPPRAMPSGSFGMAVPPEWNNWKGQAVEVRRFRLRFPDRRAAKVILPAWTFTLREGKEWTVRVDGAAGSPTLSVTDNQGQEVGQAAGELAWRVPPLAEGDYTATVAVPMAGGEEEFRFALRAVDVPDPDDTFHLVGHYAGGETNDDERHKYVRDIIDEFGLDLISVGGLRHAKEMIDPSLLSLEETYRLRRIRNLDALIAGERLPLWTDFDTSFLLLATHGATKEYDPTVPCVHHPDYETAVREKITPLLKMQEARAGHVSSEIIDEPHLYPSNVCKCELCQRLYHERYGEELPDYNALQGDQTLRRWNFFRWLEDYSTRAFAMTRKIRDQVAPEVRLHNVPIDRLFTSNFMFNAMHRWAQYGDGGAYMACYPFGYRVWRGRKRMPHSQTHWIAAWVRGLATHHELPHWGVFMDLWEHDVPNRRMPPYWSVGQFYALLAAGVTRMDTFLLSFGFEGFGISDQRLREFGFEMNKIRPYFPLLAPTRRPRARMAFVNPWCQWVMDPPPHRLPPGHEGYGYYRVSYGTPFDEQYPHDNRRMMAYELFQRTFADLDQVDEQLMLEAPLDYRVIVVSDCRFLMRETMRQLTEFVESGGVLILDCVPERDETGQATDFYRTLTAEPPTAEGPVVPGLTYRIHPFGDGAVLCFFASLQTTYADAVESERPGVTARYEERVSDLLDGLGLIPRWQATNADLDAGLRVADGMAIVPVSNLGWEQREGSILLRELPFVPFFAVNLTTGEFVDLFIDDETVEFDIALESLHGALVALFPARPAGCLLQVMQTALHPGNELACEVTLLDESGQPASGRFQVDLTVTDPAGRSHPRLGGPITVFNGHGHLVKRLPVNAVPGQWTITALDPIIGLTATAQFTVS
jgi:hypothetical protein